MLDLLGVLALMLLIAALTKIVLDSRLKSKILARDASRELSEKLLQPEPARSRALGSLKWALVLIGIGLGIGLGQAVPREMKEEMTLAGIFFFAGIGYFIYFLAAMRAAKHE